MHPGDTITAISSAVAPSARIIVRLSGPEARRIASAMVLDSNLNHPCAIRAPLRLSDLTVPGWLYCFLAPRSYTGEDVIEFHLPGNPLLARMLLDELVRRGARHADAGEFTARAYFNGRMDLSEAEGVAATIAAHSERELRAARQLLSGELARRLRPLLDALTESLALVEVGIDFSEEDVSFLSPDELRERIAGADEALRRLLDGSARFESLAREPQIVLVGRPNAGKSTLLNALAGEERAVVSSEAGTTRDAIWSPARLPRGTVRIIDVAGLSRPGREHCNEAFVEIETQMQDRATHAMRSADIVVLVRDATDRSPLLELSVTPDFTVLNKSDLLDSPAAPDGSDAIAISAKTGHNIDALRGKLDRLAFGEQSGGGAALALNARHIDAIDQARDALRRASQSLDSAGPEVIALELREALDALGRILGSVTPDDVLGRIFSTFCIGK